MSDDSLERGLMYIKDPELRKRIEDAGDKIEIPLWPEPARAVPNEVVRSALFNVRNRNVKRVYMQSVPIVVVGDGTITYNGQELRQDDEDVWLQLLHLARCKPLSLHDLNEDKATVEFTPRVFCKAIGWHINSHYYNKLETTLNRLQATALSMKSTRLGGETISLSLVRMSRIRIDGELANSRGKIWKVWLEPKIVKLFGGQCFTMLDWEIRKTLSPLGKWLQGFYQSHHEPYPIKIETIMDGCGSQNKNIRKFRVALEKAMKELDNVGLFEKWWINDGKIFVTRNKQIGG